MVNEWTILFYISLKSFPYIVASLGENIKKEKKIVGKNEEKKNKS